VAQVLTTKDGPTVRQQQEEQLARLRQQLQQLEAGLARLGQRGEGAEGARPPERTLQWFRASCYPLYKQVGCRTCPPFQLRQHPSTAAAGRRWLARLCAWRPRLRS
jgi:hypothetical protein